MFTQILMLVLSVLSLGSVRWMLTQPDAYQRSLRDLPVATPEAVQRLVSLDYTLSPTHDYEGLV